HTVSPQYVYCSFSNHPPNTDIYTLSLHDALPIYMEVVVFERNDNVSFLSCGIALYIGEVVKDAQSLFYSNPEELESLGAKVHMEDRKSTRLNSSHVSISYAVFCLKKKNRKYEKKK